MQTNTPLFDLVLPQERLIRSWTEGRTRPRAPRMETLLHHYAYGEPQDHVHLKTAVGHLSNEELRAKALRLLGPLSAEEIGENVARRAPRVGEAP